MSEGLSATCTNGYTTEGRNVVLNPVPSQQDIELLDKIRQVRDEILRKSSYPTSMHQSPSAVLGSLFFKPHRSPFYVEPEINSVVSKSPSKLGTRTLKKTRDKLITNADDSFGK